MAAPGGGDSGGTPWAKYVGIGCGVLILLSCLLGGSCYACSYCASNAAQSAADQAMQQAQQAQQQAQQQAAGGGAATTPSAGGGGVCQRATDCCNAYADIMAAGPAASGAAQTRSMCPTYAQMAATAGPMADQGCQSAIDGFRAGITALGGTVPPVCQ
ncbi:MAG: hypothetical protein OHK0013_11790 [Sandaracinaceae bacterium]